MAVRSEQKYVDQLGAEWVLTSVLGAGGVRLSITTPTGLTRDLSPVSFDQQITRRPVDSDAPLPLENL
jgi:hypothetical protein